MRSRGSSGSEIDARFCLREPSHRERGRKREMKAREKRVFRFSFPNSRCQMLPLPTNNPLFALVIRDARVGQNDHLIKVNYDSDTSEQRFGLPCEMAGSMLMVWFFIVTVAF